MRMRTKNKMYNKNEKKQYKYISKMVKKTWSGLPSNGEDTSDYA